MENNLLKNIFNNMDYYTYDKLSKIGLIFTIYGCINPLVNLFINYPVFEGILTGFVLLTQSYCLTTSVTDCEKYTKEITEIRNLYNELINNYVVLNNTLEFEHPLEIYTLYSYMLHNGFLSKDSKFKFGYNDIKDTKSILGVNVITGNAVCRHISSMLNDIYSKMNLNSSTCTAYLNQEEMIFFSLDIIISSLEIQLKNTFNEKERKEIKTVINNSKVLRDKVKPKCNLFKINNANHMINLVSKDNIGYIIDPTNEKLYKKIENQKCKNLLKLYVASSDGSILKLTKDNGNYKKKREILSLPTSTNEEDKLIITNTTNIFNNNLDMLEKFKLENQGLYNDINDKLVNVKIKKLKK